MNGYELMARSYKKLVADGQVPAEDVKRDIEIYEFLSTCGKEDIFKLVDSSAFNDIIKAYCEKALKNAKVDEEISSKVMNEMRYIFDDIGAEKVLEEYKATKGE